jgi:hypothetical protein
MSDNAEMGGAKQITNEMEVLFKYKSGLLIIILPSCTVGTGPFSWW